MKSSKHAYSSSGQSRSRLFLGGGLLILSVIAAGFWFASKGQAKAETKKTDSAETVFELAAVDVLEIVPRPFVLGLPVTGTLTPVSQVTLRSKVSAQVQENLVLEGETVRKGQLLLRLDQADLRTKLLNFDAQVEEAQAKLTMAEKTFASNEALLKQKYISQNAFDTTHNGVELAKAGLKAIVAQRQLALLALADAEVKSPVDGIVSMRHVQAGDKVSADSALVNLVNLSQMTLEANIASSEIPRIRIGQELSFQVDGFAERRFVGKVTRINPTALAGSRSMLVYLSVPNADLALKGGMFAKGNLALEKTEANTLIPLSALRQKNAQDFVFVIVNNEVKEQKVRLGLRNEDEAVVQVLEGISPGAIVITAKLDTANGVKAGSKVRLPKDFILRQHTQSPDHPAKSHDAAANSALNSGANSAANTSAGKV